MLVRKIAHIALSLLLLMSTAGVTVSKHYCSGELRSTSLYEATSCCGEQGMMAGCCHTELDHFQVDEDVTPVADLEVLTPVMGLVEPVSDRVLLPAPSEKRLAFQDQNPPPLLSEPLFVFLCVFRI